MAKIEREETHAAPHAALKHTAAATPAKVPTPHVPPADPAEVVKTVKQGLEESMEAQHLRIAKLEVELVAAKEILDRMIQQHNRA